MVMGIVHFGTYVIYQKHLEEILKPCTLKSITRKKGNKWVKNPMKKSEKRWIKYR